MPLVAIIFLLLAKTGIAAHTVAPDETTLLPTPEAPTLTAIASGASIPHSDYVRICYVSAKGETTPSAEAVYSAGSNTITVVHSPPPEPGAIGYNVYALKNSGGTGTGHVLQNRIPIAIGTDFFEPASGWVRSALIPPTVNRAVIPIPRKTLEIDGVGGYFEAPTVNGSKAALLLPSSDAPAATQLSLTSNRGVSVQLRGSSIDAPLESELPIVLETISFTFDRNVSFAGFPTFKFTTPRNTKNDPPYVVLLYDGSTKLLVTTMTASMLWDLTFESDYKTRFHAVAYRPYYAEVVAKSPYAADFAVAGSTMSYALPSVGGYGMSATLPNATSINAASAYQVFASEVPPLGLPKLAGSDVRSVLYYAAVVLKGSASYAGRATLTVTLPHSQYDRSDLRLAAYDSEFSRPAWSVRLAPTNIRGRTLTFEAQLPAFVGWREYGLALYAFKTPEQPRIMDDDERPLVVVVGESLSLLTIIPPSGVGCTPGWSPLPDCQYSLDPELTWPGVFAKLTGYRVMNLSLLGPETTVDNWAGQSMLSAMVPQIPANARVIVCQCGFNDLARNNNLPATSDRAAVLTQAMLARAPKARVVYIGVRCYIGCAAAGIAAWNEAEKKLASRYGAFVDLTHLAPDGASTAFPDGTHPNPPTAAIIASETAAAIAPWQLTR